MTSNSPDKWGEFNLKYEEFYPDSKLLGAVQAELQALERSSQLPNIFLELGSGASVILSKEYLLAKLKNGQGVELLLADFTYHTKVKGSKEIRLLALRRIAQTVVEFYTQTTNSTERMAVKNQEVSTRAELLTLLKQRDNEESMSALLRQLGIDVVFVPVDLNTQTLELPRERFALGGHRVMNYLDKTMLARVLDSSNLSTIIFVDTNGAGAKEAEHDNSWGIDSFFSKIKGSFLRNVLKKTQYSVHLNMNSHESNYTSTRAVVLTKNNKRK